VPYAGRFVPIFWNEVEILQAIDAHDRGDPPSFFTAFELMNALAVGRGVPVIEQDRHSFLRELLVLADGGLLTWQLTVIPSQVRQLDTREPLNYLQNVRDLALTVAGRDRARGQVIRVELAHPDEDDGRPIRK